METSSVKDNRLLQNIFSTVVATIEQLVQIGDPLQPWTPDPSLAIPSDIVAFIRSLNIPDIRGSPSLLLHKLGALDEIIAGSESTGSDAEDILKEKAELEKRLSDIFRTKDLTVLHCVLLNTPGSGKTRTCLEGLCRFWGFYLTCVQDTYGIGSRDIHSLLKMPMPLRSRLLGAPSTPRQFAHNSNIARRYFLDVFRARAFLFEILLEISEKHLPPASADHFAYWENIKRTWTLIQVHPGLLTNPTSNRDIILQLRELISGVTFPKDSLFLSDALGACHGILKRHNVHNPQPQLYCVVDECQYPATLLSSGFLSSSVDESGALPMDELIVDPVTRPILREMIDTWNTGVANLRFIITGTGLCEADVEVSLGSNLAKNETVEWVKDVGSFTEGSLQRYLKQYLPPSYARSQPGIAEQQLLARAAYWLFGRHRFTARFIQDLLFCGFQNPHTCLTKYIRQVTGGFTPADDSGLGKLEPSFESKGPPAAGFNFKELADDRNGELCIAITQLTAHRLVKGNMDFIADTVLLEDEQATAVRLGFARFPPADSKNPVSFDEPLVWAAVDRWLRFKSIKNRYFNHFKQNMETNKPHSNGFEDFTAVLLACELSNWTRLGDVFYFPDSCDPNNLADQRARLIGYYVGADDKPYAAEIKFPYGYVAKEEGPALGSIPTQSCSTTMGYRATCIEDTGRWLDHEIPVPFLFPTEHMGPDILFCLLLWDKRKILVAVQTKFRKRFDQLMPRQTMQAAVNTVTPATFWKKGRTGNKVKMPPQPEAPGKQAIAHPFPGCSVLELSDPISNITGSKRQRQATRTASYDTEPTGNQVHSPKKAKADHASPDSLASMFESDTHETAENFQTGTDLNRCDAEHEKNFAQMRRINPSSATDSYCSVLRVVVTYPAEPDLDLLKANMERQPGWEPDCHSLATLLPSTFSSMMTKFETRGVKPGSGRAGPGMTSLDRYLRANQAKQLEEAERKREQKEEKKRKKAAKVTAEAAMKVSRPAELPDACYASEYDIPPLTEAEEVESPTTLEFKDDDI
ncbi:hypothetical protein C8J56DRAFT_248900 [Mycena floridula]|nr:hypothetical protein C8J56DRAFT_248900 [Mycena floridula]